MDVNVVIKFDKRADELFSSLIDALTGVKKETPKGTVQNVKKVEAVSDVEMAEEVKAVNFAELRERAKKLAIQLVQKKKGLQLKELINEFNIPKVASVTDEDVEALYLRLVAIGEN